jgi:hypothetical protein
VHWDRDQFLRRPHRISALLRRSCVESFVCGGRWKGLVRLCVLVRITEEGKRRHCNVGVEVQDCGRLSNPSDPHRMIEILSMHRECFSCCHCLGDKGRVDRGALRLQVAEGTPLSDMQSVQRFGNGSRAVEHRIEVFCQWKNT